MQIAFTLEDIDRAHEGVTQETVRKYLADLHGLGVFTYTTYISDGHSEYFDIRGNKLSSAPVHEAYAVSDGADREAMRRALDAHGRREMDYFTFVRQLAAAGVCTWVMNPVGMTCSYHSKSGELLRSTRRSGRSMPKPLSRSFRTRPARGSS
ncbi:DUF1398 family protein [Corallococcus sp. bb12-1]|uniref:DUF1398 family protein n=1 Tax=Corallococcus sp. bb12-1 TaxID=2996784 RepID=UPI003B637811